MGNEEVISAMHAATQKLMLEQIIHPQMIDTGPPLLYPIPKDPAWQDLPFMYSLLSLLARACGTVLQGYTGRPCS